MRIGVDVDGVLADRVPAILDIIEERHGVRLAVSDVTGWEATVSATGKRLPAFFAETDRDPSHVLELPTVDGAVAGMNTLAEDHQLVIATYRDPAAHDLTARWLRDHDIPFDSIVEDPGEGKTNVDTDLLIDDSGSTVRAFARERAPALLFSQPWNDGEDLPRNAAAVSDWDAVLRYVADGPSEQ